MSKDKPTGDPFPQLPRRGFYADGTAQSANPHDGLSSVRKFGTTAQDDAPEPPKASAPAKKAGRPVAPKPWLEAGVSRMTWHRREKKAKASRDGV